VNSTEPFNKTTRQKITVCQAFGLHYWSDHPLPGRMWAVDDHQGAHVIRWYRARGFAVKQSGGLFGGRAYDTGERIAV
jgi:hypothetical protein